MKGYATSALTFTRGLGLPQAQQYGPHKSFIVMIVSDWAAVKKLDLSYYVEGTDYQADVKHCSKWVPGRRGDYQQGLRPMMASF